MGELTSDADDDFSPGDPRAEGEEDLVTCVEVVKSTAERDDVK